MTEGFVTYWLRPKTYGDSQGAQNSTNVNQDGMQGGLFNKSYWTSFLGEV